ncbi:MAG: diguanylate cyclase (GGDEF)-like protein [Gammaproteobacteria bacterium]
MLLANEESLESIKVYEDLARDLDKQIRDLRSVDSLLRKTIRELCIVARGHDRKLDSQLGQIQTLARTSQNEKLRTVLTQLIQTVHSRDPDNKDDKSRISDSIRLILELLHQIKFDDDQRKQLKPLSSGLLESVAHEYNTDKIRPYITQLADLINEGFLTNDHVENSDELLVSLCKTLSSFNLKDGILDRILADYSEDKTDVEKMAWLESLVDRIGHLVKSLSQSREDLESFILEVTDQLNEIAGAISQDQKERLTEFDQVQAFQQSMNQGVDAIQDEIEKSQNIETLKQIIGKNIRSLKSGVSDFVDRSNQRRQEAETSNQELSRKISRMEQHRIDLQNRLTESREKMLVDTLTGAGSRLAYNEQMENELARWQRHGDVFSYAILDIDFFKRINDQHGHIAGDNALKLVSKIMMEHTRKSDYLFRIGGEEFVLLLIKTGVHQAATCVEAIRNSIEKRDFHFKKQLVRITLSAGITESRSDDLRDSLYERADKALYQAKNSGRNCQFIAE